MTGKWQCGEGDMLAVAGGMEDWMGGAGEDILEVEEEKLLAAAGTRFPSTLEGVRERVPAAA